MRMEQGAVLRLVGMDTMTLLLPLQMSASCSRWARAGGGGSFCF